MNQLKLPAWASYPKHPLHRALYRLPILAWRLGLGAMLGPWSGGMEVSP
jgi:hypothetical protein